MIRAYSVAPFIDRRPARAKPHQQHHGSSNTNACGPIGGMNFGLRYRALVAELQSALADRLPLRGALVTVVAIVVMRFDRAMRETFAIARSFRAINHQLPKPVVHST
jgi:hypothetical protein